MKSTSRRSARGNGRTTEAARFAVEAMEDRRLLSAGNILVAGSGSGNSHVIREYTQAGVLVRTITVPNSPAGYDQIRDIAVDQSGKISVWQGTFNPYLGTYDGSTWTYRTALDWNTYGSTQYGQIAAYKNYVYAEDLDNGGPARGIIRWDMTTTNPGVRTQVPYSPNNFTEPADVTMGMDGYLYDTADFDSHVFALDPDSMQIAKVFTFPSGTSGNRLVVDTQGNMYANGGGYIRKFSPAGTLLKQIVLNCHEMDISDDNKLLILDGDRVCLVDSDLNVQSFFNVPGPYWGAGFVSWSTYQSPQQHPPVTTVTATFDPVPALMTTPLDSFTIRFNVPVTGLDKNDLRITSPVNTQIPGSGSFTTSDGGLTWVYTGLAAAHNSDQPWTMKLVAQDSGIFEKSYGYNLLTDASMSWTVDRSGPTATITAVTPNPRSNPVTAIPITFSRAITGFDLADLSLTLNGSAVSLANATLTTSDGGTKWSLGNLAGVTASQGNYVLKLNATNSGIVDSLNRALNGSPQVTWSTDIPPTATIAAVSPNPRTTALSSIGISFSESVTGFDLADLTLSRDGVDVSLSGATLSGSGANYTLSNLSAMTSAGGSYVLSLNAPGSGITDAGGSVFVASTFRSWYMDTGPTTPPSPPTPTPPVVTIDAVAPNPRSTAVSSIGITFNEAVTGFDLSDLSLWRNGAGIALDGAALNGTGSQYTLTGLDALTATSGAYVLAINASNSGIVDVDGTALGTSIYTTWFTDPVAPTAAFDAVLPVTRATGVDAFTLRLSKPVLGLDVGDFLLSRDGDAVPLTDAVLIPTNDPTVYTLSGLATETSPDGSYVLSIGPSSDVTSATGVPMTQAAAVAFVVQAQVAPLAATATVAIDGKSATLNAINAPAGATFSWQTLSVPVGAADPMFANAAAPTTSVSFNRAGVYLFEVDTATESATVQVKVAKKLSKITVTPAVSVIAPSTTKQFAVAGVDQFGQPYGTLPTVAWSIPVGNGTMTQSGLYAAPVEFGNVTIGASCGGLNTTASFRIFAATKIDFTKTGVPIASGYLADTGLTFNGRNGRTYGWNVAHSDSTTAVDRNKNSNQLLDTNIGVKTGGKWELSVANGTYSVKVGTGDSSISTKNTVIVEGKTLYSAQALSANVFSNKTITVTVTDGKLTLSAGSAANLATRLTFLEVTAV